MITNNTKETNIKTIQNPILPGFNPDPCMIRVNDMYYIAVSSFEWLPGVRIYQSDNLADWEFCTDVLTDQVNLKGIPRTAVFGLHRSATMRVCIT